MSTIHLGRWLSTLAFLGVAACAPGTSTDGKSQPTSLREVEIPADFTFATSRPTALTVSADPAILTNGAAALEIRRPDGAVLYRGPLQAGQPLDLSLSVPTKDEHLELVLTAEGREMVAQVAVADGQGSHQFR